MQRAHLQMVIKIYFAIKLKISIQMVAKNKEYYVFRFSIKC